MSPPCLGLAPQAAKRIKEAWILFMFVLDEGATSSLTQVRVLRHDNYSIPATYAPLRWALDK